MGWGAYCLALTGPPRYGRSRRPTLPPLPLWETPHLASESPAIGRSHEPSSTSGCGDGVGAGGVGDGAGEGACGAGVPPSGAGGCAPRVVVAGGGTRPPTDGAPTRGSVAEVPAGRVPGAAVRPWVTVPAGAGSPPEPDPATYA